MNFSSRPSSRLSAAMEFAEEMSDVIGDVHLDEEGHVFDPRSGDTNSTFHNQGFFLLIGQRPLIYSIFRTHLFKT